MVLFPTWIHHCYLPTQYLFSVFFFFNLFVCFCFFLIGCKFSLEKKWVRFEQKKKTVFPSIPWTLGCPMISIRPKNIGPSQLGVLDISLVKHAQSLHRYHFFFLPPLWMHTEADGTALHSKHRFLSFPGSCFYFSRVAVLPPAYSFLLSFAIAGVWEGWEGKRRGECGRGGEGAEEERENWLGVPPCFFDLSLYVSFHFKFPPSSARIS